VKKLSIKICSNSGRWKIYQVLVYEEEIWYVKKENNNFIIKQEREVIKKN
jgi:hypothetical protein